MVSLGSGPGQALRMLGLLGRAWPGAGLMLLATLPMAVLAFLGFQGARIEHIIGDALLGPLAEEILFRGFLFVLLVQVAH